VEARIGEFLAWVSQQSQLAMALAETVLQLPDRRAEERVRELARVEPWSVALALLGGVCQRLTGGEPAPACALAELAVAAAEEMAEPAHPASLKAALLVHTYLLLADSRHRAGQTEEAGEALERAELHLAEASPGAPRSRLLRLLPHFRRMQLSFDRANQSLDLLVALLEERADFDL
jgi:hypothetical protein